MNFLAHSALAFDDPALLAGQFAGDFVRGTDLSRFPSRVASGIRLHRRIDVQTDAHPAVAAARHEFPAALRRHAGIVIDVIFDHWLAREWPCPAGRDLASHAAWVDSALSMHDEVLPERLRRLRTLLTREQILVGNVELANVATTLQRLSTRSAAMAPLSLASRRVEPLAERLHVTFRVVWPAIAHVASERRIELVEAEVPVAEHEKSGTAAAGEEARAAAREATRAAAREATSPSAKRTRDGEPSKHEAPVKRSLKTEPAEPKPAYAFDGTRGTRRSDGR